MVDIVKEFGRFLWSISGENSWLSLMFMVVILGLSIGALYLILQTRPPRKADLKIVYFGLIAFFIILIALVVLVFLLYNDPQEAFS